MLERGEAGGSKGVGIITGAGDPDRSFLDCLPWLPPAVHAQVGAVQISSGEISGAYSGVLEVGVAQVSTVQVSSLQIGASQDSAPQSCIPQLCRKQAGCGKVSPVEIDTREIGLVQTSTG